LTTLIRSGIHDYESASGGHDDADPCAEHGACHDELPKLVSEPEPQETRCRGDNPQAHQQSAISAIGISRQRQLCHQRANKSRPSYPPQITLSYAVSVVDFRE
jgi:hypothetical protein